MCDTYKALPENLTFQDGVWFHLISNSEAMFNYASDIGEHAQWTQCRDSNNNHEHYHSLYRLNKIAIGNTTNIRSTRERFSRLVRDKLGKLPGKTRHFLLKEIVCSSHLNGVIHYMGCSQGQSTFKNRFKPHIHYNRHSMFIHRRKNCKVSPLKNNTTGCYNIMCQIEADHGINLHILGRDSCDCIETRIKEEKNQRMKKVVREQANQHVDNQTDHSNNLNLRRTIYKNMTEEERNAHESNFDQTIEIREKQALEYIAKISK